MLLAVQSTIGHHLQLNNTQAEQHTARFTCVGVHQAHEHRVREALACFTECDVRFAGVDYRVELVLAVAVLADLQAGGWGLLEGRQN